MLDDDAGRAGITSLDVRVELQVTRIRHYEYQAAKIPWKSLSFN